MKKYKVIIDSKKCIGCGNCSMVADKYIKINQQSGLVDVSGFIEKNGRLVGEISEQQLDDFERAARVCTELVIKIIK
ncbi:hypothetical protein C0580_03215 [Candidatus Parcubacteria bacterium]|nr:MAG: hypothetical protein C0580_03215 [Candidatus Parcubacteria bacterium]